MLTHHYPVPQDPSRVVVLGAGGFIGGALVAALARAGISTLPVTRSEVDLSADGAGDLLAAMLLPTDAVVFAAAITPDRGRGLGPFLKNIHIGGNVCAALEKLPVAHVVYFSSDAVYPFNGSAVTEQCCAQPTDLYGMMHLARELMVKAAVSAQAALLRPTLVYGHADTHNSYGPNRLRRMAFREGRITLFGEGEELRDYILVDDVVALTLHVLRRRSSGTLNLATGRSLTYAELAKKIASLFDTPVDIVATPRQNPMTHRLFDVSALRQAFPDFAFTPLDEGLAKAHHDMLEGPGWPR